jgi:hypothetical protein
LLESKAAASANDINHERICMLACLRERLLRKAVFVSVAVKSTLQHRQSQRRANSLPSRFAEFA